MADESNKMARVRDCCRCNRSGRCQNCTCVKYGSRCSGCLPGRLGRCRNGRVDVGWRGGCGLAGWMWVGVVSSTVLLVGEGMAP